MNMSYCRFQNTAKDLDDCLENLFDGDLSKDEAAARESLIRTAYLIIEELGGTVGCEEGELLDYLEQNLDGKVEDEDEDESEGDDDTSVSAFMADMAKQGKKVSSPEQYTEWLNRKQL